MMRTKLLFATCLASISTSVCASDNLVSLTVDNDLFLQQDEGYTNGLYLALYERGGIPQLEELGSSPKHSFLVSPLMWSMPSSNNQGAVNALNIGQTLFTPKDLSLKQPNPNDIPYSAMIAITSSYITLAKKHADMTSTSIGVVGPAALGEPSQKLMHKILGSEEPQGWDAQLKNELVFQFGRGRVWRTWAAELDNYDVLTTAKAHLGTIQSSVNSSVIMRYGRDLKNSFGNVLLMDSRTTNPIAVNGEWYVYAGLEAEYIFNQVFTDGNTFRDSASIDYDREFLGLNFGITYSWGQSAITFAVNHSDIFQTQSDQYRNETRYGTITFASKI
ncbi:lipid A deacylase LpxR family protein [Marinomonas atlantica]|uniref:lipid A deacylase LpxR family protein n=1 Tax=Marinomonas atlantica TaxID=1806668 RepID=UPI0009ED07F7|nr:lipid A deacylase LpxR family protein [Marinomonas atlantica]